MTLATMTSKGQFTIPKDVRETLGLRTGSRLDVSVVDGALVAVPRGSDPMSLSGIMGKPPRGAGSNLDEIDRAVRQSVADHVLGKG